MISVLITGGVAFVVGIVAYMVLTRPQSSNGATKKTWTNDKLHTQKSQSDIILNAIEDGVVVVDTQKIIRLFNPAASRLTGWPQDEAININFDVVLRLLDTKNKDYSSEENPFNKALTSGKPISDNTATLFTRSKKSVGVSLSVSPLLDQDGQVTGVVGVFRDVTEQREAERQRAEFISTASHEMRTPVASIEGYLALAMNDKVSKIDTKARDYLQKAHESTQHLGQLFQDLLTSTRVEDGRLSNHPQVVEASSFLEKVCEDLRFSAQQKNLVLEYVVGTNGATITGNKDESNGSARVVQPLYYINVDPERLREVVTDLFDNAIKYTDKGKISIGITGDDKIVQVYVRDTGIGIAPEDIPHLFQKFYRVDNSATRTVGGTGLGLFICRKIIEMYNGRIWVESELNKGSTFYINIPRVSNDRLTPDLINEAQQISSPRATQEEE